MAKKPERPSIQAKIDERLLAIVGTKMINSQKETYELYLASLRRKNRKPYHIPKIVVFENSITHSISEGMKIYRINARKRSSKKRILYLHGGSYVSQPEIFHWTFLDRLAAITNASIIVPIYPKAPDHVYTEAFTKVLNIYKKLASKSAPEDLIIMGDSAGGGFALALAQVIAKKRLPQPENIILLSPWLDVSMTNPVIPLYEDNDKMLSVYGLKRCGLAWAGGTDVKNPMVSPVYGELEGLGKITLFIGTHEVLLPDCRKLRDRAAAQGIEMNYYEAEHLGHVFPLYPGLPEANWAIDIMTDVITGCAVK